MSTNRGMDEEAVVHLDNGILLSRKEGWCNAVCSDMDVPQFSSVAQCCPTLRPNGLHHGRLACPSPILGAYLDSYPSSQWCHPIISSSVVPFSSCLQSFPASGTFLMSLLPIMWPKYWSFSFSISPFNEDPGLISFRMDWFDLLAVQGTLKSLLQHNSSKASVLWCSAFFKSNSHIHTWLLEKP